MVVREIFTIEKIENQKKKLENLFQFKTFKQHYLNQF